MDQKSAVENSGNFCSIFASKQMRKRQLFSVHLNRNTVYGIFYKISERIAEFCEAESPFENDELELDESYVDAYGVRGMRGHSVRGKTPVSGMTER